MLLQCCSPPVNMPSSFVPWSCVMADRQESVVEKMDTAEGHLALSLIHI